jgi:putative flippase GtrA
METIQQLRATIPKETKRFIKFLFVGGLGFVVDFGSFNLFHTLGLGVRLAPYLLPAAWSTYLIAHPEIIEQSCSFALAVCSNFLWNYFWIYPEARVKNQANKFSKFILVSVAGLIIGVPVFSVALFAFKPVVIAMGLDGLPFNVAGNLALMARVGVLLFWNFFVNRKWTYGDVPVQPKAASSPVAEE